MFDKIGIKVIAQRKNYPVDYAINGLDALNAFSHTFISML